MMRSMFSAVSGLRVHQNKMDVIANNISNVNTVGFKSSRVTFAEVFSQTTAGASSYNQTTGRGGVNPTQIGLGAKTASIGMVMTQGVAQRTDVGTDLMIQGDAFFIVGDNGGRYFTREGAFNFDASGNLVNSRGLRVFGWQAMADPNNPGGEIISKTAVSPIVITSDKKHISPEVTKNIAFEGNINQEDTPITTSVSFFDSLGNKYVVEAEYVYEGSSKWTLKFGKNVEKNGEIIKDANGDPVPHVFAEIQEIIFDENGYLVDKEPLEMDLAAIIPDPVADLGDGGVLKLDLAGLTMFAATSTPKSITKDGTSSGVLTGTSIGSDGIIRGSYSNGGERLIGQIAVARFENPEGLERKGDNLYSTSANSGGFDGIGEEPQAAGGSILAGHLEMSNVDLSNEFTEMIITQRGFQANSRVITTSDEMLQELVNLKR